jgi:hypothetical protein
MGSIADRRWPVIALNLVIWAALVALAIAIGRRRAARPAIAALAVAMAWVPLLLLLTAWLEPSVLAERLIVGAGAPALAVATLLAARRLAPPDRARYGAFAFAAAASIAASALDVIAGSPLTALSLLGPNPALGVRFFGIGNELEATIGVLLLLGAGAAVTARAPADPRRAMALVTVAAVGAAVLVFAPGRLGADVGAAITFPAGAAIAVIAALRLSLRRALLVLAAPVAAVLVLVLIDLITGGDAHLSRSVLGAGGLDDLGDVVQRRVRQAARSFTNYLDSPFFAAAIIGIGLGIGFRRRIGGWLRGRPAAAAAVWGAAGATVVGTVANDSGALLLMVGTGFIAAFCGLAWAASEAPGEVAEGPPPR